MAASGLQKAPHQALCKQEEVGLYSNDMLTRPAIIIANKLDKVAAPEAALEQLTAGCSQPVLAVSGLRGDNIEQLRQTAPADSPR